MSYIITIVNKNSYLVILTIRQYFPMHFWHIYSIEGNIPEVEFCIFPINFIPIHSNRFYSSIFSELQQAFLNSPSKNQECR
ncbi:hypothetical protein C489_09141 [Natrinema versiforme JCM 10478]|uniref:Uncharacterized protein n=1 Tax=Natrinema versiforme JCM 10478 TaxID=1227496 RepID=L9Y4A0_9EURY|nr:hypothetical protein C489_09141 [Natrinema versiforme JCM 10478]